MLPFTEMWENWERISTEEENQEFDLEHVQFEMSVSPVKT